MTAIKIDKFKKVLETLKKYFTDKKTEIENYINEKPGKIDGWNDLFTPTNLVDYFNPPNVEQSMILKGLIQQYGTYLSGRSDVVKKMINDLELEDRTKDINYSQLKNDLGLTDAEESFIGVVLGVYKSIGIKPYEEITSDPLDEESFDLLGTEDPIKEETSNLEEIIDSEPINLELQEKILEKFDEYKKVIDEGEEKLVEEESKNNIKNLVEGIGINYENLEEVPGKIEEKTIEIKEKYQQKIKETKELNEKINKRIKGGVGGLQMTLRKRGFL